jgi:hypothetical protein
MELNKPVFEVMRWPESELDYWSLFFNIKPTDKPIITTKQTEDVSVVESKSKFKMLFG